MEKFEIRTGAIERRSEEEGRRTLVGYASVWGAEADIGGEFIETFERGAFADAINGDVRALVGHNHENVIGRTSSGTLRLEEDERGLRVEIDVPDTTVGRDLWTLVERGDVTGMSIGFSPKRQEWDFKADPARRTIKEAGLREVSVVAWPAYDDTSISIRSFEEAKSAANDEKRKAASNIVAVTQARMRMKHGVALRKSR